MSLASPSISPQELMALIGTPHAPLIFDTRRRAAFDEASRLIPGAKWHDHQAVDEYAARIPMGREVVVCCVHGHQVSQSAVSQLRAHGINARKLEGGIEAYMDAGGTTILKSDGLPKTYEAASRWITRERPKIDRLACPWLIRRFVDPEAEILYADADWVAESAVELDAVAFDVPDVEFSHHADQCSFDAFIDRFDIQDDALRRLAEIVRSADTGRLDLAPEAAGLDAVSLGISAANEDDHAALMQGMVLYDALYSWLRHASDETHNWPPAVSQ